MAMNRVQFQPGLSMVEFMQRYGSEAQCEAALIRSRWPQGFACPACRCHLHTTFKRAGRTHWQCRRCRHQTTATAGTIFASTKLPLTVWFLAMHLLTQAKNNVSALELMRHLGLGYSAAWRIKHKILHTMARRESRRQLSGRVEIDDAYLGGECPGKRGRGSPNKVPFVIGVSTVGDNRAHQVAIRCTGFTKDAISQWANTALHADTQAWSDGLAAFGALAEEIRRTSSPHHRLGTCSGRTCGIPLCEYRPRESQNRHLRHLSCVQLRQIYHALPRGISVSLQSSL